MKLLFKEMHSDIKEINNMIVEEIDSLNLLPCKNVDSFGIFLQIFLAIASLSVLIIKRSIETRKRIWKVWVMDVSKQVITACIGHLINLFISEKIGKEYMNQCNWYFINLITDVLIGTFLNIMAFKQFESYFSNSEKYKFVSGEYYRGNSCGEWFYQTVIWFVITNMVKCFMVLLLFMNLEFFSFFSSWILAPFLINPRIELIYVMILAPVLLNGWAFWMTDSYLKKEEGAKDEDDNEILIANTEKRLRRMMTT